MLSDDAKALINYFKTLIKEEKIETALPEEFVGNADIQELSAKLKNVRDVTAIKKLEKKLKESEERYRLLIDNAGDIISTVNLEGDFTYISPSVEKITGYTPEEIMNHYLEINYFLPDALKVMQKTLEIVNRMVKAGEHFSSVRFEQKQYRKDGSIFWTDTILSGIYDETNQFKELLGVTREITEKVKLREEIIKLSETDKLTQIYNRLKLDDALETELIRANRTNIPFAVILLDIDDFKAVNDKFGHQAGDKILIELAKLMKSCIRTTDLVGRWGGEEFIFILPDTDENGGMQFAEKIRKRVSETNFIKPEKITVSLGVSVYRSDVSVFSIISRADQALYASKNNGRNQVQLV